MNIGLTGGMGCGKSTALRWLQGRGVAVFETDACVRQLLACDRALLRELRETFGEAIFTPEGAVDRARLAEIVFSDTERLTALEALLHPRVRAAWKAETRRGQSLLFVEIPLLFEKNLQSGFDLTCCICTDEKVQMQRLRSRGWSEAHVALRLQRQWSVAAKAKGADVILLNDGEPSHLEAQLDLLLSRLGFFRKSA